MSLDEWETVCDGFEKRKYRLLHVNQPIPLTPLYPVAKHATTVGRKEAAEEFKTIVSMRPKQGVQYCNENYDRIGKLFYTSQSKHSLNFSIEWLKMDVERQYERSSTTGGSSAFAHLSQPQLTDTRPPYSTR